MPELPEVETIARGLRPALVGRKIVEAKVYLPKTPEGEWAEKEVFERVVTGRVIKEVGRRGKLLLVHFEGEQEDGERRRETVVGMAFHLKMTGRLFAYDEQAQPNKHTRVAFRLQENTESGSQERSAQTCVQTNAQTSQLFFDDARTFGYVRLFSSESLVRWPFWVQLGPEPLEIEVQDFCLRMHGRRGIKAMLLDQHVIAGVGNIYADEALFSSGIHPNAKGSDISYEKLVALHGALQAVLQQSIEECGSSIRDYRDAQGNAGAFQNLFRVYGRSGEKCMTCGTPLTTAKIAGRTTVFCGACQRF